MSETQDIAALEEAMHKFYRQFREAKAALRAARIATCGVSIGDIVTSGKYEYQVADITPFSFGVPWVSGFRRTKLGWGKREYALFGQWTKLTPTPEPAP